MTALLVDLGGTHLRCGVLHERQTQVIHRARIRNFTNTSRKDRIWLEIVGAVGDFADGIRGAIPSWAPVVVSFPGPVMEKSRIVDAPTVAGESASFPDLHAMLSRRTGRDVHILNDISAAAWHVSRRIGVDRFMVVTVSSGIGSKIFDRRHPKCVLDDVVYAGEIGHVKVDESSDAPQCDCGGQGHLGAISSGRGIERRARLLAKADPLFRDSLCAVDFGATPEYLNNEEHIVPAIKAGDGWPLNVVRSCTEPLARILLQSVVTSGVERVVVIGGFALSLGEMYRRLLQEEFTKRCDYRVMADRIKNLIVMGDEDACLLGTAAYAAQIGER